MNHPFEAIADGHLETGNILQTLYTKDPFPGKVNLLRGAYEAESGKPFVLPSVIKAREKLYDDSTWHHDYLPFLGNPRFLSAGEELFFGSKSHVVTSQLLASMQAVGGTGAIHMGARFLKQHYGPWQQLDSPKLYLPRDTWINHRNVFKALDIELVALPYYDPSQKCLDWDGLKSAIQALPLHSVVLVQTAAHNPTGCDPGLNQWHELVQVFLARKHFAILDVAYLGLISGNTELDARSIRIFADSGVPLLLAGTFGKSFGLYGERVAILSIVATSQEVKNRMKKHLTLLARSETGASPSFGAKVVEIVLGDQGIRSVWESDLKDIATELRRRREVLRDELQMIGAPGDWDFLTNQVGMFSYLGFTPTQLEFLRTEHHIYVDRNTRMSFASLSTDSIKRLAYGINRMIRSSVA